MYQALARARRNMIAQNLNEGELLILFAGNDELGVCGIPQRKDRDTNFFYLVGTDIPEGLLVLARIQNEIQEHLFIRRNTENDEFYMGFSRNLSYFQNETGISSVMYIENFNDIIESFSMRTVLRKVYFASAFEGISKYPRYDMLLAKQLKQAYPGICIDSMAEEIAYMRLRKDPSEVEQIRKAIQITAQSLRKTAQQLKPGLHDYQLQSILEHEIKMNGAEPEVVEALIGQEATIMHNFYSHATAKDGDLFLADICTFYHDYCCDISRTFPVNGKFTQEQAYWYQVCLKTQELVIEHLAPGKLWSQCGTEANAYLEGELRKHGYLGKSEDVRMLIGQCRINYATPGMVNHGIGLHYHEKRMDEEGRLAPGMVFAVEPGIYLRDKNIGIRIEDNILITENGVENLSKDIPKKLEDIEAMMK